MKSTALLTLAWLSALPAVALAQEGEPRNRVVIVENVKFDYAQVLNVESVFQTLRATRMERVCDAKQASGGGLSKVVSAVKERLTGATTREERDAGLSNCRMAPVVREYRRPIAYDVDYVYKGTKYRSRLAEDPGNRLRIRVAVTPWEAEAPPLPPP